MKNNSYLYGEDTEVPEIPQSIIDERVDKLKANLEKLLDHSYYTRDGLRINAIIKAIKFWETINEK